MINAYSSAQSAHTSHSTAASMANGAASLYARQNLPPAAARAAAALAANEGAESGADKVRLSPEALALQQAERDSAPPPEAASTPSRFAANGVPVDFSAWQAAARETDQRIEERLALYKKGQETDATDDAILRRIAAYDERLAGPYLPADTAPPVPANLAAERAGDERTLLAARRNAANGVPS